MRLIIVFGCVAVVAVAALIAFGMWLHAQHRERSARDWRRRAEAAEVVIRNLRAEVQVASDAGYLDAVAGALRVLADYDTERSRSLAGLR